MTEFRSYNLADLCYPDIQEYLKTKDLILIPMASTEQHGPHLPLKTDTVTAEEVARRVAQQIQVLYTPCIWMGYSPQHLHEPGKGRGTITIRAETLLNLMYDVARSLIHHGFNRLIFVNGHGSNLKVVDPVLRRLRYETGALIGFVKPYMENYVGLMQGLMENPLEETLETFDALRREGKLRFIGCSNYRAWRIEQAREVSRRRGWAEYCCVQQRHTYLRPAAGTSFGAQLPVDAELADYCAAHAADFLLLGYSSTLGGAYAGRPGRPVPAQYAGPDTDARLAALGAVARETGTTPVQVMYAWMLQSTPVVLPLVSAGTLAQLDENLGSLSLTLSAEHLARLDGAGSAPGS